MKSQNYVPSFFFENAGDNNSLFKIVFETGVLPDSEHRITTANKSGEMVENTVRKQRFCALSRCNISSDKFHYLFELKFFKEV